MMNAVINGVRERDSPKLNVWPNPVTDRVAIDGLDPGTPVEAFSLMGQRAMVLTAKQGAAVDVSKLAPGSYLLRAEVRVGLHHARFVRR